MAIAFVASDSVTPGPNGGTTAGVDTTGANFLVAVICYYHPDEDSTTPTDSKSNTWTPLTAYEATTNPGVRIFYVENATVGTGHTLTFSDFGSYPTINFLAFSGVLTSSSFDTQNGATGSAITSLQTGSVTPATDGSLLIAGLTTDGAEGGAPSIDNSFTIAESNVYSAGVNMGGFAAYKIQSTAAAINPQWSWTNSIEAAADIAVFGPAAGGGGATPKNPFGLALDGPLRRVVM